MKNVNDLDESIQKAIALMQHNGDDYFILEDASETLVYEGKEDDARKAFDLEMEDNKDGLVDFFEWAKDNLTEVEPIEGDDEKDGYIVLTDSEADDKAKEYIIETLWAFNAEFLAEQTDLDPEIFQAIIGNGKCEDNNDVIYNTIQKLGDIDYFVSAAISADGRGHFMSSYDGNENEERVGDTTYYIYRVN